MNVIEIERWRAYSDAHAAKYLNLLASYPEHEKPVPLELAGNLARALRRAAEHMRAHRGRAAKRCFCAQLGVTEFGSLEKADHRVMDSYRSMTVCYSNEYKLESRQDYSNADTAAFLDLLADYTECGEPLPQSVAATFENGAAILLDGKEKAASRAKRLICVQLGIKERNRDRKGACKAERFGEIPIKPRLQLSDAHYSALLHVDERQIRRDKKEIKDLTEYWFPILRKAVHENL